MAKKKPGSKVNKTGYFKSSDTRLSRKTRNFQEQCFLVELWAEGAFENYETTVDKGEAGTQTIQVDQKKRHGYKNFIAVESTNHENVIKLLAHHNTKDISVFSKFKPHHWSALVPTLKLYKILYHRGKNKKPISLPFYFPTNLESDLSKKTLLENKPIGNVGIESFSWNIYGSNPVAARKDIQANLTIFLQQLGDLEYESSSASSITQFLSGGPKGARYIDLLMPAKYKTGKFNAAGKKEAPYDFFRVNVEVGWAMPSKPDAVFRDFTKGEIDQVKSAIRQMKKVLNLGMVDHDINFNQDGTVSINIRFQGGFEAVMDSSDSELLIDKETKRALGELHTLEESTKKEAKKISSVFAGGKNSKVSVLSQKAALSNLEKKYKKTRAALVNFVNKSKAEVYSTFVKNMEEGGRIFDVIYDTEAIAAVWQKSAGTTYQNVAGSISASIRNRYLKELRSSWPNHMAYNSKYYNKWNKPLNKPTINPNKPKNKSNSKIKVDLDYRKTGFVSIGKGQKPKYQFSFFFLGDLIDLAIGIARGNSGDAFFYKNTTFLLGPVKYYNSRGKDGKGEFISRNMADIPVSYDFFRKWFNNNIVKRNLKSYKLREFLRDIFSPQFLGNILGGKCNHSLSFERSSPIIGLDFFDAKISSSEFKNTSNLNRCWLTPSLVDRVRKSEIKYGSGKNHNSYLLYYAGSNILRDRRGNPQEDLSDGIFHFFIGSQTGVLKTMNFQKENWPLYAAARMSEKSNFARLGQPYSVTINTFGMNYFRPGQYIYINPRRAGINRKLGKELMLEGYYIILKVDSSIRGGQYETTIQAKWSPAQPGAKLKKLEKKIPPLPTNQPPRSASSNRRVTSSQGEGITPTNQVKPKKPGTQKVGKPSREITEGLSTRAKIKSK